MFMAVVNDTYAEIKSEMDSKSERDFPIGLWVEQKMESLNRNRYIHRVALYIRSSFENILR